MKTIISLALSATLACSFAANAGTVSVGATPVPHAEILEFVKPMLAKEGVDLKIVEFNDYVQPNLATDDGEINANFFQHQPYLDAFAKDHGVDLVSIAKIHVEPMGVYSKKIKDLKDLKEGALVAIPNDPTNGGRALLLLASANLITLEDPTNIQSTVLDIKENKLNLEFKELEAAQLPRSLEDVDIAIINTNFALPANLDPSKDALLIEGKDSPYANILVANKESANTEDMQKLVKALSSKDTADFILTKYKGAIVPVTN